MLYDLELKPLLFLFVIFLFISGSIFTDTLQLLFGSHVMNGKSVSMFGMILQGVSLIMMFLLALYLCDSGII